MRGVTHPVLLLPLPYHLMRRQPRVPSFPEYQAATERSVTPTSCYGLFPSRRESVTSNCILSRRFPMAVPFTGGCACGAIRYECTAEPLYMGNCHCRDCQRATGSAYFPAVGMATTAFRLLTGTPAAYATLADSGHTM